MMMMTAMTIHEVISVLVRFSGPSCGDDLGGDDDLRLRAACDEETDREPRQDDDERHR